MARANAMDDARIGHGILQDDVNMDIFEDEGEVTNCSNSGPNASLPSPISAPPFDYEICQW